MRSGSSAVKRLAGQVDEHGDPRPDRLGHLEHPHHLALLEPDDGRHEPGDGRRLELEDELAGQVLEHRAHGPPGVRVHARLVEVERVGHGAPTPGMSSTLTR